MPRRIHVCAVLVVVVLVAGGLAPPAGAADDLAVVTYRHPVDGPIVDRFAPPQQRWQAGNRGIDYGVAPGTPVVAAAAGEVVFAGAIGGALHVTVRHADGLRTSYSFLAEIRVHAGQQVRAGQLVGVTGGPVHVGVRTPDGTYLDPEALFAGNLEPRVVLVPGVEDGLDPLVERRSLFETLLDSGSAAAAFVADRGGEWARLVAHYQAELDPWTHAARAADAAVTWASQRLDCTDDSTPVAAPPDRRIAVVVSGLGTGSGGNSAWELDTTAMGYADTDVVRFSYNGGRAPGPGTPEPPPGSTPPPVLVGRGSVAGEGVAQNPIDSLDDIPVTAFTATDSQQDLTVSAERLEQLLVAVARAEPGVPIDVLAHSQGGVVSRLAVVQAGSEGLLPPTVENLVTVGSPHQGAPLATAIVGFQQSPGGQAALDAVRSSEAFPDLDDRRPAIPQLSETSTVLHRMRELPVPDGVRFTSVGSGGDLTVPATATADPQADTHVILPAMPSLDAHGDLTTDPRTTREVTLAVSGAPPTCQGLGEAVLAFGEAELVRTGETNLALAAQGGALGASPMVVALDVLRD